MWTINITETVSGTDTNIEYNLLIISSGLLFGYDEYSDIGGYLNIGRYLNIGEYLNIGCFTYAVLSYSVCVRTTNIICCISIVHCNSIVNIYDI